jgi:hypothetical protein
MLETKEQDMKKLTVMLLALGLFVGAANADTLMFSGSFFDVFFTTPVAVGDGSEGLVAFTIRAVNTTGNAGYDPTSFDGVAFGYTGISGVLHQHRGPADSPDIVTFPAALAASINAIDTHFLTDDTATAAVPLSENYLTDSAEGKFGYYGETWFGDNLTGAVAINHVGATWDIAQVVTNDVGSVTTLFFLSGTAGGEVIDIPEPATMGLLAIGGLGALIRRRK